MTPGGPLWCSGVSPEISGYHVRSAERRWTTISVATSGTSSKCSGKIVWRLERLRDKNISPAAWNRTAPF